MKKRLIGVLLLAGLAVLGTALAAQAEIYKFYFNAWTQRSGTTDTVQLEMEIADTSLRAPDAIASLTVKAPDGTVLDMTNSCWIDLSKRFWNAYTANKFLSGTIPAGKYVATVVDKSTPAKTLSNSDTLTSSFLTPATITYPTAGATGVPLTPTFKWGAVSGAQHYRILLFNNAWGEPVYWKYPVNPHHAYRNSYTVPRGDLKPNTQYRLCIEARDNDKNMGRRSYSTWITFTTAP
jgi:hypothetical protein